MSSLSDTEDVVSIGLDVSNFIPQNSVAGDILVSVGVALKGKQEYPLQRYFVG